MSDELVEAVAATIACNSPSGLQYPWHRAAALAIVAEVIERCARLIEENVAVTSTSDEHPTYFGKRHPGNRYGLEYADAIRKLGESDDRD